MFCHTDLNNRWFVIAGKLRGRSGAKCGVCREQPACSSGLLRCPSKCHLQVEGSTCRFISMQVLCTHLRHLAVHRLPLHLLARLVLGCERTKESRSRELEEWTRQLGAGLGVGIAPQVLGALRGLIALRNVGSFAPNTLGNFAGTFKGSSLLSPLIVAFLPLAGAGLIRGGGGGCFMHPPTLTSLSWEGPWLHPLVGRGSACLVLWSRGLQPITKRDRGTFGKCWRAALAGCRQEPDGCRPSCGERRLVSGVPRP